MSSFAGFLLTLTAVLAGTPAAANDNKAATPALGRWVANKLALNHNAIRQRELHKEIDDSFAEIRALRRTTHPRKGQGPCDSCAALATEFCNRPALYPEFCHFGDCHVEPEPGKDVCYRVYRNENCYKTLTSSARAKVNACWMVENRLEIKDLEAEIDNLKAQLDGAVQEQYDLMKYELALEEECPRCPATRMPAQILQESRNSD